MLSLIGYRLLSTRTGPIALHKSSNAYIADPLIVFYESYVIIKINLGIKVIRKWSSKLWLNLWTHGRPFEN
jgi:hypothetical protein